MSDSPQALAENLAGFRDSNQRYLGYLYLDGYVRSQPAYATSPSLQQLSRWLRAAAQINAPDSVQFSGFNGTDYRYLEYTDQFLRSFVFEFNDNAAFYAQGDRTLNYSNQELSNQLANAVFQLFESRAFEGRLPSAYEIGQQDVYVAVQLSGNPSWAWAGGVVGQAMFGFPNPIGSSGDLANYMAVAGRTVQELGGDAALIPLAVSTNPADRLLAAGLKIALDFEELFRRYDRTRGGFTHSGIITVDGLTEEQYLSKRLAALSDIVEDGGRGVILASPTIYSEIGGIIGASIGNALSGGPITGVLYSSLLGELGERLGQLVASGNVSAVLESSSVLMVADAVNAVSVARGFSADMWTRLRDATLGSVSSLLALELGESLGLQGFGAELFTTGAGSVIGKALTNLSTGGSDSLWDGFRASEIVGADGALNLAASAIGSFLGAKLGSLVVRPETQASAILSSAGSAIGAYAAINGIGVLGTAAFNIASFAASAFSGSQIAALVGNIVLPGVGAFVGFVLGALIGNLFGRKKPRTLSAWAETVLQLPYAQYGLGASQAQNNGNLGMVTSMATIARDSLNGLISAVAGEGRTAFVSNLDGTLTDQRYGHRGNELYIKFGPNGQEQKTRDVSGQQVAFTSADQVVEYGALRAIRNTKIIGGDIFAKRAILRSPATDLTSMAGDLQIASDYGLYAANREQVNGLIKGAYGLSETDEAWYDAWDNGENKRKIDKLMVQGYNALTQLEKDWYNNPNIKATADRLIQALEDQSLANPWIITLQRISELGLDKWAPSDFYGGLRGFLDSFDLKGHGTSYENIAVTWDGSNPSFTSNVGAAADGLFSILPDAVSNGRGARVSNFGSNVGYFVRGATTYDTNDFVAANLATAPQTISMLGGDDILVGGRAGDLLHGNNGWDWIDGGAGNDSIYGGQNEDVLVGGAGSDRLSGDVGDDYLAGGDGDERYDRDAGLFGGDGRDTLVGGAGEDDMSSGEGDDTFIVAQDGGGVWDWMDGGGGRDTVSFERFTAAVGVNLGNYVNHPWAPDSRGFYGDGSTSVENLTGSNHNDWLRGDEGANWITGLAGNDDLDGSAGDDTLEGGAGADKLFGWDGWDMISYVGSTDGVYVNFKTREALGGDAEGDTWDNIAHLQGSNHRDELTGAGNHTRLWGMGGDDWFNWSGGHFDVFDGGEGFDTVDYTEATSAVTVKLQLGVGSQGRGGAGDQAEYYSIEGLIGSAYNDVLEGTATAETFEAGKGNDAVNGGDGLDTYVFNRHDGIDTIYDERNKGAILRFGSGVRFSDLSQAVPSERTYFELRIDTDQNGAADGGTVRVMSNFMVTSSDQNILKLIDMNGAGQIDVSQIDYNRNGSVGADTLEGGVGSSARHDFLTSRSGNDIIRGNRGASWEDKSNVIIGGLGNDYIETSLGDDQFGYDIGDGIDYIVDVDGIDTLVLGSTISAEDVVVTLGTDADSSLYVDFRDPASTTGGLIAGSRVIILNGATTYYDDGTIRKLRGIEHIVAGGAWIDLTKLDLPWQAEAVASRMGEPMKSSVYDPIVFDLGDDGLNLTSVAHSSVVSRTNDYLTRVGWVDASEGMLAVDRNGDGRIDRSSELMFSQDNPGSAGDLAGLEAWDTNEDGKLNTADKRFGELLVWVDTNQNGRSTPDELRTLTQAGIASLTLGGELTGSSTRLALDNVVTKTTSFTRTDGTTGDAYEVALARRFLHADGLEAASDKVGWAEVQGDGEFGRLLNDASEEARNKKGVETLKESLGLEKKKITYAEAASEVQTDFSDTSKSFEKDEVKWAEKDLKRAEKTLAKLGELQLLEELEKDKEKDKKASFSSADEGDAGASETMAAGSAPPPMSGLIGASGGNGFGTGSLGFSAADVAADLLAGRQAASSGWDAMNFAVPASGLAGGTSSWWRAQPMSGESVGLSSALLSSSEPQGGSFAPDISNAGQVTEQQRFRQAIAAFNGNGGAGVAVWRRSGESGSESAGQLLGTPIGRQLDAGLSRRAA